MKLYSGLLFIVLLNILPFINAFQPQLYRDKTVNKWYAVAAVNHGVYNITQDCVQVYFIPQHNDIWSVTIVEYFKSSNLTLVESKNMTTAELDANIQSSDAELGPAIKYDNDRQFILYDSKRDLYFVLSRSIIDRIFEMHSLYRLSWNLKSMAKKLPPVSKPGVRLSAACGNNRGGQIYHLRDQLTQAVMNWITGKWYAVGILRQDEVYEDLNCIQKQFKIKNTNNIEFHTIKGDVGASPSELSYGVMSGETILDIYDESIAYFHALLNLDDNEYFFLFDNPKFYYVLSRSRNVTISLDNDLELDEIKGWTLQLLDQENCTYNK